MKQIRNNVTRLRHKILSASCTITFSGSKNISIQLFFFALSIWFQNPQNLPNELPEKMQLHQQRIRWACLQYKDFNMDCRVEVFVILQRLIKTDSSLGGPSTKTQKYTTLASEHRNSGVASSIAARFKRITSLGGCGRTKRRCQLCSFWFIKLQDKRALSLSTGWPLMLEICDIEAVFS